MAYVNDIRRIDRGFAAFARESWRNWQDRAAKRRVYRRTLFELSSLSDRELDDLGLHRSMITEIAREAAYGG